MARLGWRKRFDVAQSLLSRRVHAIIIYCVPVRIRVEVMCALCLSSGVYVFAFALCACVCVLIASAFYHPEVFPDPPGYVDEHKC